MPTKKHLRNVLAENVTALRLKKGLSQPKISTAALHAGFVVGQTTVGRVERAVHAADVDTIEALAKGLGVEPWQLLISELNPASLPGLGGADLPHDEQELLRDYRAATDTWKLTVRLVARARPEDQMQLSKDMNILMTTIFGKAVPDKRVEETYGFPPGSPSRTVHQPPAPYKPKEKK